MSDSDSNEPKSAGRAEVSDEKIAGLLRLTGPRPPVPEDRALRVKAVVRDRWRAETRRRPRRRIWIAAALATAAALVALLGPVWRSLAPPAPGPMPRIVAVVGQSSATPGGDGPRGEVRAGFEVPAGSLLETGGDGRLALRLSTGASLRLDVRTRIEIASDRSLALLAGAVYIDSGSPGAPAGPADGVEIHTPAGLVREIGTQFEVRLTDAAVRLRVREGMVTVDRPAGRLEVTSGRELRVDGDGSTGVRDLPPHGEDWAWIEAITPLMEIEGRSLREFLDWMARERGLGIRFAAGDLEAAAADIRLKGSIAGMSLDQALESVLMTCRMRPRIAGDLLIVERLDGTPGTS